MKKKTVDRILLIFIVMLVSSLVLWFNIDAFRLNRMVIIDASVVKINTSFIYGSQWTEIVLKSDVGNYYSREYRSSTTNYKIGSRYELKVSRYETLGMLNVWPVFSILLAMIIDLIILLLIIYFSYEFLRSKYNELEDWNVYKKTNQN